MDIPQARNYDEDSTFRFGDSPLEVPNSYVALHSRDLHELRNRGHSLSGVEEEREPFPMDLLPGEAREDEARFLNCTLTHTNYRVCVVSDNDGACAVIPLADLDTVDAKDPLQLVITCKEGRVFRLTADSSEVALYWYKRLTQSIYRASTHDCFAWPFAKSAEESKPKWLSRGHVEEEVDAHDDFRRLDFDPDFFRVSKANVHFEICETYPQSIIVPSEISDDHLKQCKDFRFLGRFPSIVWRCKEKNTVLIRSSQPRTGIFSWRNSVDEKILECVRNSMESKSVEKNDLSAITILDARSYTAAWANRAKGGGFESGEYYRNTMVEFLGLPNIHNVRYSFHQLRALLNSPAEQTTYLQQLQTTNWFLYLSNLITSAVQCVDLLMDQGRSVLVHCSDGWDRTTQIVSLAKIISDPYYRTMQGFESVIRREWVAFGHKFADRNGIAGSDSNERAPVFLQFLDGVHQLMRQHKTAFEFNMNYLVKLAQHCYSGLFGTFLHNSLSDARKAMTEKNGDKLISIWRYLHKDNDEVVNQLYDKEAATGRLRISVGVEYVQLWREVYCCGQTEQAINAPEDRQTMTSVLLARAEMEKSIVKSNSSDSLNSIQKMMDNSGLVGSFLHGSNTRLNETSTDTLENQSITDFRKSDSATSRLRSLDTTDTKSVKDLIDKDGLVMFRDVEQDRIRKINRENRVHVDQLRAELSRVRQRRHSERTEGSLNRERSMRSFGDNDQLVESDFDCSLDRAFSDASLVEVPDVGLRASGWVLNEKQCTLCRSVYNPVNREHHCRKCLKSVCDSCSRKRYHEVVGGSGEQMRACDECYSKMHHPEPIQETDIDGIPNVPPKTIAKTSEPVAVPVTDYNADTESPGSLSQGSFVTATQSVQG